MIINRFAPFNYILKSFKLDFITEESSSSTLSGVNTTNLSAQLAVDVEGK